MGIEGNNVKMKNKLMEKKLKNKLTDFTCYLNMFFTLSHTMKLFYQIYLIYLIKLIKLLNQFIIHLLNFVCLKSRK